MRCRDRGPIRMLVLEIGVSGDQERECTSFTGSYHICFQHLARSP
jgi:hypothetical protein